MNYEEMSDYDINELVAKRLGINVPDNSNPYLWKTEFCLHELNGDWSKIEKTFVANYCNDPSDAHSILVDNGIIVDYSGVAMMVGPETYKHITKDKNPLRAAMICFLKMKEKQQ